MTIIKHKVCNRCNKSKPLTEFYKNKRTKDGFDYSCSSCVIEYQCCYKSKAASKINKIDYRQTRKYYEKTGVKLCASCKQLVPISNYTKYKQGLYSQCKSCYNANRTSKHRSKKRKSRKEQLVALLGGKCHRCGYKEFMNSLDFHHIDPSEKELSPSTALTGSFETAYKEVDKCILLCANCHRAYEAGYWKAEFIKRNGLGYSLVSKQIKLNI